MASILITGGAGFIGSHLVELLVGRGDAVTCLDALTYAGCRDNLAAVEGRIRFVHGRIEDAKLVAALLGELKPDAVINVAAETHVDRSIDDPDAFLRTNVEGTLSLLRASLRHWQSHRHFRFVQVSTDEVYGSLAEGAATEDFPFRPSSPYAASKASADHLVAAWGATYGLPVLTTHGSNTYGPRQHPEKLIPLMVLNATEGKALPVYGDGLQRRDWMWVGDHAAGIAAVLDRGRPGERYNLGGGHELGNLELVRRLCARLDGIHPRGAPHERLVAMVADRPGHDRRYALDCGKAAAELGWRAATDLGDGLAATVDWLLAHPGWGGRGGAERRRQGLGAVA